MAQLPKFKSVSRQGLLGQKGVNLIEHVVLEMGSTWTPGGPNEVGIDGFIELFDPASGAALGTVVAVQSKAVSEFMNESADEFDYWCERRDLEYWLQGNTPMILVVSRPATGEAYWVSVRDYFTEPGHAGTTKIRFSKKQHRFAPECLQELVRLGRSPESGLYLAPAPKAETLHSNLLRLEHFPDRLQVASTDIRTPGEMWAVLRRAPAPVGGAWILRDRRVITFHDLREDPWIAVCEAGTIETFATEEWAGSDDPDRARQFVQLLNETLRAQSYPNVRYWPREDCYAYSLEESRGRRKVQYRSLKRESSISAVVPIIKQVDERELVSYRHVAFRGQFRRIEGDWYLEITPTYRFTRDGLAIHRFHEDWLKGIKRIEGNRAVLSTVLFWAHQLRGADNLLEEGTRWLEFSSLMSFGIETGIQDDQWQSQEPASGTVSAEHSNPTEEPALDFGEF